MSADFGFNDEPRRPRERREDSFRVVEGEEQAAPHSLDAERHVLACCLLDGADSIGRCLNEKLSVEGFYGAAHRLLFPLIVELYERQPPVTLEMLVEELSARQQLEAVGGMAALMEIVQTTSTSAQLGYFIERIKELWIRREMIREAVAVGEQLRAFQGSLGELENVLAPLASRFYRSAEFARGGDDTMQQRAAKAYERTKARLAGKIDTSRHLLTGLREFDHRFGAFDVHEEEWFIGVAAVTSGGKSALTRNWADSFARFGKKGVIFLLETSVGKYLDMAAATASRVNARMLHCLPVDKAQLFARERETRQRWLGERWWIYDDPIRAETLCARVEEHVRQHGRPDYVIVDHLHELYSSNERFKGFRSLEVGYIAKLLKRTAKRLDVPFIVPMQLNRGPGKEARRPSKHDLRDSGEVENAVDRMVLIHIPKEDMRGVEQTGNQLRVMVELIQDKSRNGPIGHREFWFDRGMTLFTDVGDHELHGPRVAGGSAKPSSGGFTKQQFKGERKA